MNFNRKGIKGNKGERKQTICDIRVKICEICVEKKATPPPKQT